MATLELINKEVDETTSGISHQHIQLKDYLQVYLLSLGGLFAISGFFSSNGEVGIKESIIGSVCTLTVFFLGWLFLSIVSHRASMLILLYKHLAFLREMRANEFGNNEFIKGYVLPAGKGMIKMPGLLHYLPYFFFAFNFLILCGGLAFFLSPHMKYHQIVACVSAAAVFFGSFYPLVCVTFKRHVKCAEKANTIKGMRRLEDVWHKQIMERQRPSRTVKVILAFGAIVGSIVIAAFSFVVDKSDIFYVVTFSWTSVIAYALIRFFAEKFRISFSIEAVDVD